MIGEKVLHYQGKGVDIGSLSSKVEEYLKSEGFTVQSAAPSAEGAVLQAKKGGWLAAVVDADRALSITFTGSPDDAEVKIGIGKWLEHLGIAAIETLLISELFLVVDVAESLWNLEIEDKLAKKIDELVG